MRKITKKFLSTVLGLSLLAGFSVSVASFASEFGPSKFDAADINEDNIYIADTYDIETTFDPEEISPEVKELDWRLKDPSQQLGNSTTNYGWVKFGDVLFLFHRDGEGDYISDAIPLSFDNKIEVLVLPRSINGLPVTGTYGFGILAKGIVPIDEMYPNLKVIVFPEGVHAFNLYRSFNLKEKPIKFIFTCKEGIDFFYTPELSKYCRPSTVIESSIESSSDINYTFYNTPQARDYRKSLIEKISKKMRDTFTSKFMSGAPQGNGDESSASASLTERDSYDSSEFEF